jgi:hypothetical protein
MTLPFQQFARLIAISGLLFLGCCSSMPTLEADDQCSDASVFDPGRDPLCLDQYVPAKSQDDPVAVNATLTALRNQALAQAKAAVTQAQTAVDAAKDKVETDKEAAASTPAAKGALAETADEAAQSAAETALAAAKKKANDPQQTIPNVTAVAVTVRAATTALSQACFDLNNPIASTHECWDHRQQIDEFKENVSEVADADKAGIPDQVMNASIEKVAEGCFDPKRAIASTRECQHYVAQMTSATGASTIETFSIAGKSQLSVWPSVAAASANPSANNSKSQQNGSTSPSGSVTVTTTVSATGKTQTTPSSGANTTQNGTKTSNGNSNSGSGAGQVTNVRLGNLYRMYEQSETRCLYWKSKRNVWFQFADNSYNFADLAVAAIVPILAFTNSSNESIGLVGAFVALFGGQLKSAVNGVTGDGTSATSDFSQTQSQMQAFYKLYSSDPYFQDDGKAKYNPFMSGNDSSDSANATLAVQEQDQAHQIFHLFKLGMEYSCYSNLSFSSGSKSGNSNSSGGSSNGGQGSSDDGSSQ